MVGLHEDEAQATVSGDPFRQTRCVRMSYWRSDSEAARARRSSSTRGSEASGAQPQRSAEELRPQGWAKPAAVDRVFTRRRGVMRPTE